MACDHIFVDRMDWVADLSRTGFCPKCNFAKAGFLTPDLAPSYLYHLPEFSVRNEFRRDFLTAQNIHKLISLEKDNQTEYVTRGKKFKAMVFVNTA